MWRPGGVGVRMWGSAEVVSSGGNENEARALARLRRRKHLSWRLCPSAESKQRADLQRRIYCSRNASVQAGAWLQRSWQCDVALTSGRKRVKRPKEPITPIPLDVSYFGLPPLQLAR